MKSPPSELKNKLPVLRDLAYDAAPYIVLGVFIIFFLVCMWYLAVYVWSGKDPSKKMFSYALPAWAYIVCAVVGGIATYLLMNIDILPHL